jgi:isoaspartyl peptidase/L-asparaginase-like protein (Ntn-hydrolase superfamily)
VALDRGGHVAMPFNSHGMFRACVRSDGRRLIGIHR